MASGDSSPCGTSTRLSPVSISMQGDESPDAIMHINKLIRECLPAIGKQANFVKQGGGLFPMFVEPEV